MDHVFQAAFTEISQKNQHWHQNEKTEPVLFPDVPADIRGRKCAQRQNKPMLVVLKDPPTLPGKRNPQQIDQRLTDQEKHKGLQRRVKRAFGVRDDNDSEKDPCLQSLAHPCKGRALKDRKNQKYSG